MGVLLDVSGDEQESEDALAQLACQAPPVLALDGTALYQMQPSPGAWANGIHYRPVADILSDALGYPLVQPQPLFFARLVGCLDNFIFGVHPRFHTVAIAHLVQCRPAVLQSMPDAPCM